MSLGKPISAELLGAQEERNAAMRGLLGDQVMPEFTPQNSYPCPSCGQPKLKDEWKFCPICLVAERAKIGGNGIVREPCPKCSHPNDSLRRRCESCRQKLRPRGRTRDMTAGQTGGASKAPVEEGEDRPLGDQLHPLVIGLLQYLPGPGDSMDLMQRFQWLQTMEANLSMAYGESGEQGRIEIRLAWKRTSRWDRFLRALARFEWFAGRIRA